MIHVKGKLAKQIKERMGLESPRKPRKPRQPRRVPKPVLEARNWKFTIKGYLPPGLNDLLQWHWVKRRKAKSLCAALVKIHGIHYECIPPARSKRTVLITLTRSGNRKELDDDNCARKSVLDALVRCGLLMDDAPRFCHCPEAIQVRGTACSTTIELRESPDA